MEKSLLKAIVRGCYDIQSIRLQTGGRLVSNFRAKLGYGPSDKTKKDKDAEKVIDRIKLEYDKLTEGIAKFPTKKMFKGTEIISDYAELILVRTFLDAASEEKVAFRRLKSLIEEVDLWVTFLKGVKGCGPALAGVIYTCFDIFKAEYPSSLWMYAGLDVAEDGRGRSKRKEHLVDRDYINKKGEPDTKKSVTYNPFLKAKLIGVLGPSFLRSKSEYSVPYYEYKNRIENHEVHKEKTKAHIHNMSVRYMIKRFLVDLYVHWRTLEGLPVADEYSVAKLGMTHKKADEPA